MAGSLDITAERCSGDRYRFVRGDGVTLYLTSPQVRALVALDEMRLPAGVTTSYGKSVSGKVVRRLASYGIAQRVPDSSLYRLTYFGRKLVVALMELS